MKLIEEQSYDSFKKYVKSHHLLNNVSFELVLYNKDAIIHKLSHQHLYTKFWIVNTDTLNVNSVLVDEIHDFPVPIIIGNFIDAFNF